MGKGICNIVTGNAKYNELQKSAKAVLRSLYNDKTFEAFIQDYYDNHDQQLPNNTWMKFELLKRYKKFAVDHPEFTPSETETQTADNEWVVIVSESNYRKEDPAKEKDTAFVYNENAQANAWVWHLDMSPYPRPIGRLKVNVGDYADTDHPNTAGIRTDEKGNRYPNVFGIIVKKWQQGSDSKKFAEKEGQFKNNIEDEKLFKELNLQAIERIKGSGFKKIKFPSSMAMGRAALPRAFAEWLRDQIEENFGLHYEIGENKNDNYEGYGLFMADAIKNLPSVSKKQNTPENTRKHWATSAEEGYGFEVSEDGDELGRQFSPLRAILPEGSRFYLSTKKDDYLDLSGYSIAAAWGMLRGHDQLGNKQPAKFSNVVGWNEPVTRKGFLYGKGRQKTYNCYLYLWQMFADSNPELIAKLRNAIGDGNKLLTDKYAKGTRYEINQAKALSDILFGNSTRDTTGEENSLERQLENAKEGAEEVLSNVTRSSKVKAIKNTREEVALAKGKDVNGNSLKDKRTGQYLPKGILTFDIPMDFVGAADNDARYINPFKGKDAIRKFLLWIFPDDWEAIPENLRKGTSKERRKMLRSQLTKGELKGKNVYTTDMSTEGIRYADVLRYLIDHFPTLRRKYNPVTEFAQEWALSKKNVIITDRYSKKDGTDAYKVYTEEDKRNKVGLDEKGEPSRFIEVVRKGEDEWILNINGLDSLKPSQLSRLLQSVAQSLPDESTVILSGEVSQRELDTFRELKKYGFTYGSSENTITIKETGEKTEIPVIERSVDNDKRIYEQFKVYDREEVAADDSKLFLFFGNIEDLEWMAREPEEAIKKLPEKGWTVIRGLPNAVEIPVMINRRMIAPESKNSSYFNDSKDDFNRFKAYLDVAMERARKALDEGKQVVLPGINGTAMLETYSPSLYKYYREQIDALLQEYNEGALGEYEKNKNVSDVDRLEGSPIENNLDNIVDTQKESPYIRVQQVFGSRGMLGDAIETVGIHFIDVVDDYRDELIDKYESQLEDLDEDDPEDKEEITKLNKLINNLRDDLIGMQIALKEMTKLADEGKNPSIMDRLVERFRNVAENAKNDSKRDSFLRLCDKEIINVLLQYATNYVRERKGVTIVVAEGKVVTAKKSETEEEKNANDDDPEAKKTSGANDWSFNVRLNDPYQSLSTNVRRLISNLRMRDPNNPSKSVVNGFGEVRHWDPKYIYACLMSFMAKNYRNNSDNFYVLLQKGDSRIPDGVDMRQYPFGYPVFPILEQLQSKYTWASDLMAQLRDDYCFNADVMTDAEYNNLGDAVSQLITNFGQQFISYYVMKDGHVYPENWPTGEESLRESVLNNYEGGVVLNEEIASIEGERKPLQMIYDYDHSVNVENVFNLEQRCETLRKSIAQDTNDKRNEWADYNDYVEKFWESGESFENLYKDVFLGGDKLPSFLSPENGWFEDAESYETLKKVRKQISDVCVEMANILRSMGIEMNKLDTLRILCNRSDKDTFGNRISIAELLIQADGILSDIKSLSPDDHIINTAKGAKDENGNEITIDVDFAKGVEARWRRFFKSFGEYVSEREFQSSFRSKDGNTRYSYSAGSFMSSMLINLTNQDTEQRHAFMRDAFMPYEQFYDAKTETWKLPMLQDAWDGTLTNEGHDVISIVDNSGEGVDYSDWTPEMIENLMLKEFYGGSPREDTGVFIIPILSDKECCKTISFRKEWNEKVLLSNLRNVALQEYDRIKLVRERARLIELQNKYFNDPDSVSNEEKEELQKKNAILPIAVFDVDDKGNNVGLKFNFFPELNTVVYSYDNPEFRPLIDMLNESRKRKGQEAVKSYTVIDMLDELDTMDDMVFHENREVIKWSNTNDETSQRMSTSKRELINHVLEKTLSIVTREKFDNWAKDKEDTIRKSLVNAVVGADPELKRLREGFNENTPENEMTETQKNFKKEYDYWLEQKLYLFYLNHTNVMSQFIQVMVTDVAFFKNSDDFSKRWYSIYGSGKHLNTNSKYGKKTENYIIVRDSVRRSRSYEIYKAALQRAVDEKRIAEIDMDVILTQFKKVNATDAQAYKSLTSYRTVMDMAGMWTYEMEVAYNNLNSGNWTMADFHTIYQTLKPFAFSNEAADSGMGGLIRVPTIHKNSEAVLFAIYATIAGNYEDLKDENGNAVKNPSYSARTKGINMAMEDIDLVDENNNPVYNKAGEKIKAIDLVQFVSATKIGSQGVIDINYSRDKLKAIKDAGKVEYGGVSVTVYESDSYYDIVKKIDKLYDKKEGDPQKITEEQYNGLLDQFEPDAEEVKDIIEKSIRFDGTKFGCKKNEGAFNKQVLHSIPYSDYCIQQPTPEHLMDNDKATFGSQIRHIIMSDLPDDFDVTINGRHYKNREELRRRYNSLILANLFESFKKDIESLFDKDSKKFNIHKLRDKLLSIVHESDKYGRDIIQALDIVEDPDTHKSTFALPLNNINATAKLEEILMSLFKNSISKQKIHGGNAILEADMGYAESLKIRKDSSGNVLGVECYLPASSRKLFEPLLKTMTDEKGNKYKILDANLLAEKGLDKMIGYRIPTEGHYSCMPLIVKDFLPQQSGSAIIVAADITTLSGSDNDVDKMFLFTKAFDEDTLEAIDYDPYMDPRKQSKKARDNELIDIMHSILTHPKMSDKWMHPGNFNNLKLNAKRLKIMKDWSLLRKYKASLNIVNDKDAIDRLKGKTGISKTDLLEEVEKFLEKYDTPRSPVYLDSFISYHQQNMAGVAEKGIFANNTINQAKLQWTEINLTERYTFNFGGRKIKRIDGRYIDRGDGVLERISSNCAECSAASVDNAKDPVLADVNSNVKTAPLYGFMLRLGLDIEETSLLMAQPAMDYLIKTTGELKSSALYGENGEIKKIRTLLEKVKVDVDNDPDCTWYDHNFTKDELYENILYGRKLLKEMRKDGKVALTSGEMAILKSLYRTYHLMANIVDLQQAYSNATRAMHDDSPTHAVSPSFAGCVLQTKEVQNMNELKYLSEDDKMFEGVDDLLIYDIEGQEKRAAIEGNDFSVLFGLSSTGSADKLFNKILDSKMPITQGFYTLGIESARKMFKDQLMFGRPEVQEITDMLCSWMDKRYIFSKEKREKVLTQAYRDIVVYMLSKNSMFGDDDNFTYDEKRQYYLYQYPLEFLKLKKDHPELNNIEAISRMTVHDNKIVLIRQGQMSVMTRDILMDSFDSLFSMKDPVAHKLAADLFMYCYYLNGYEFSYMSFGNLFGTQFLTKFPKYIKALRDMQKAPITEVDIDRFFWQFLLKNRYLGLLENINVSNKTFSLDDVRQKGYFNTGRGLDYYGSDEDIPEFITVEGKGIYRHSPELSFKYNSLIYVPIRANTSMHLNANQTVEDMINTVYDSDLIKDLRRVGNQKKSTTAELEESVRKNNDEIPKNSVDQNSHTTDVQKKGNKQLNKKNVSNINTGNLGEKKTPDNTDGLGETKKDISYLDDVNTDNFGERDYVPEEEPEGEERTSTKKLPDIDLSVDLDSYEQSGKKQIDEPLC